MKEQINEFIEPIYRFCMQRLSSRADAEDLAQEILLCVLEGMKHREIKNLSGYIWRIAHNRYARRVEQFNRETVLFCSDEFATDIPASVLEEDDDAEEYEKIFKALHTLSASYRDIMVAHYVHGLSVKKIAAKFSLSVETVKWRLHTGREKMKERYHDMNRTYDEIKMHIMCNGSFNPNKYLCNQIYKAIALHCYEKPLTIEEISLATGIPTLYLQEALEFMEYGDAVEKIGSKYQTNFIILRQKDNLRMQKELASCVSEIADRVWEVILKIEPEIRKIKFYGSDFPMEKLAYILVPMLIRNAKHKVNVSNPQIVHVERPLRKDGGNGWFIVTEGIDRLDENYSGCNQYYYSNDRGNQGWFTHYWLGAYWEDELCASLKNAGFFMDYVFADGTYKGTKEDDIAKSMQMNLIKKVEEQYMSQIPVFTAQQFETFSALVNADYGLDMLLTDWILMLTKEYKHMTPKRLADQIYGNVNSYAENISAFVIKELQKNGAISNTNADEIFTNHIYYVKNE